jgi:hypothetical protein
MVLLSEYSFEYRVSGNNSIRTRYAVCLNMIIRMLRSKLGVHSQAEGTA